MVSIFSNFTNIFKISNLTCSFNFLRSISFSEPIDQNNSFFFAFSKSNPTLIIYNKISIKIIFNFVSSPDTENIITIPIDHFENIFQPKDEILFVRFNEGSILSIDSQKQTYEIRKKTMLSKFFPLKYLVISKESFISPFGSYIISANDSKIAFYDPNSYRLIHFLDLSNISFVTESVSKILQIHAFDSTIFAFVLIKSNLKSDQNFLGRFIKLDFSSNKFQDFNPYVTIHPQNFPQNSLYFVPNSSNSGYIFLNSSPVSASYIDFYNISSQPYKTFDSSCFSLIGPRFIIPIQLNNNLYDSILSITSIENEIIINFQKKGVIIFKDLSKIS